MKYSFGQLLGKAGFPLIYLSFTLAAQAGLQPVAHWRFDSAAGEKIADLSTGNPSATLNAAPGDSLPVIAAGSGKEMGGVDFNGTDKAWVRLPVLALNDASSFTIEIWAVWRGGESTSQYLLGNASGVVVMITREGRLRAMLGKNAPDGPPWVTVESPATIKKEELIHLMLRVDQGTLQLAIHSRGRTEHSPQAVKSGKWDFDWKFTSLGLNPYDKESRFNGRIQAIKIYNGVLSDAEFESSQP